MSSDKRRKFEKLAAGKVLASVFPSRTRDEMAAIEDTQACECDFCGIHGAPRDKILNLGKVIVSKMQTARVQVKNRKSTIKVGIILCYECAVLAQEVGIETIPLQEAITRTRENLQAEQRPAPAKRPAKKRSPRRPTRTRGRPSGGPGGGRQGRSKIPVTYGRRTRGGGSSSAGSNGTKPRLPYVSP